MDDEEINIELIHKLEAREPTDEDVKNRTLSAEEQRELCLRLQCRVNMHWWNPVHMYKKAFTAQGRLQNKSTRDQLKLLTKAVNRHKERLGLYTEDEIAADREHVRKQRLKDNLMLLDLWKYDREVEARKREENLRKTAENTTPTHRILRRRQQEGNTNRTTPEKSKKTPDNIEPDLNEITTNNNNNLNAIDGESQIVVLDDTEVFMNPYSQQSTQLSQTGSELNLDLLQEFCKFNTESFSLSELHSQDPTEASQPVLTEDFDIHVPLTSTQKSQDAMQ